jgi:hypothetical protein
MQHEHSRQLSRRQLLPLPLEFDSGGGASGGSRVGSSSSDESSAAPLSEEDSPRSSTSNRRGNRKHGRERRERRRRRSSSKSEDDDFSFDEQNTSSSTSEDQGANSFDDGHMSPLDLLVYEARTHGLEHLRKYNLPLPLFNMVISRVVGDDLFDTGADAGANAGADAESPPASTLADPEAEETETGDDVKEEETPTAQLHTHTAPDVRELELEGNTKSVATATTRSALEINTRAPKAPTAAAVRPPRAPSRRKQAAQYDEIEVELERDERQHVRRARSRGKGSKASKGSNSSSRGGSSSTNSSIISHRSASGTSGVTQTQAQTLTSHDELEALASEAVARAQKVTRLQRLLNELTVNPEYEADFDAEDEARIIGELQQAEKQVRDIHTRVPPAQGTRFKLMCTLQRREALIEQAVATDKLHPVQDASLFTYLVQKQIKLLDLLRTH